MDLSIWGKFFEPEPGYYSETYLQKLWNRELWKHYYTGLGGESIQILDPGFHNPVHGPDFKNAKAYIAGVLVNGDVELHFENSDWYHHGHHSNPDYNSVILHVVFKNADGSTYVSNERRRKIPVLCIPYDELPHVAIEKSCPLSRRPADELMEILKRQGQKRILEKSAYFYARRRRFTFDLLFFWGIFKVCGYRYNSRNFISLFLSLPWDAIRNGNFPDENLEALLFYHAGINPVNVDAHYEVLAGEREKLAEFGIPRGGIEWSYAKSRPNNFPDRRIAYLAALIRKWRSSVVRDDLIDKFLNASRLEKAVEEILEAGPYAPYWQARKRLGGKEGRVIELTPGKSLRREFLLNILYPLLKSEEMSASADEKTKTVVRRLDEAALGIRNAKPYLDVEKFLDRHGIKSHPEARKWMVSQGVIYVREHYCGIGLQALCPVCGVKQG